MHCIGHDHHIHARLNRFADQCLQGNRFNRQLKPSHIGHDRGMPRYNHAQFFASDMSAASLNPRHVTARLGDASHFGFLQNMHAHIGTRPRIAPSHGVMAR